MRVEAGRVVGGADGSAILTDDAEAQSWPGGGGGGMRLRLERFGHGPAEDLQRRVDAVSHASVHVALRALNVVVEVRAETCELQTGT